MWLRGLQSGRQILASQGCRTQCSPGRCRWGSENHCRNPGDGASCEGMRLFQPDFRVAETDDQKPSLPQAANEGHLPACARQQWVHTCHARYTGQSCCIRMSSGGKGGTRSDSACSAWMCVWLGLQASQVLCGEACMAWLSIVWACGAVNGFWHGWRPAPLRDLRPVRRWPPGSGWRFRCRGSWLMPSKCTLSRPSSSPW